MLDFAAIMLVFHGVLRPYFWAVLLPKHEDRGYFKFDTILLWDHGVLALAHDNFPCVLIAVALLRPWWAMALHRILLVLNHVFFVAGKDVEGNSPSSLKDETPQTPNSISKVLWDREPFPVLLSFLLRILLIILALFLRSLRKPLPPFLQELCVYILRERKWVFLHGWDDKETCTFLWLDFTSHRRT